MSLVSRLGDFFNPKCQGCKQPLPSFPNSHLSAGKFKVCNMRCLLLAFDVKLEDK